jgi:hypothetical protein
VSVRHGGSDQQVVCVGEGLHLVNVLAVVWFKPYLPTVGPDTVHTMVGGQSTKLGMVGGSKVLHNGELAARLERLADAQQCVPPLPPPSPQCQNLNNV